jgi:hypothetical protein
MSQAVKPCNERSSLLSLIVDCDESQRAARGSGSFAAALRACLASSDVVEPSFSPVMVPTQVTAEPTFQPFSTARPSSDYVYRSQPTTTTPTSLSTPVPTPSPTPVPTRLSTRFPTEAQASWSPTPGPTPSPTFSPTHRQTSPPTRQPIHRTDPPTRPPQTNQPFKKQKTQPECPRVDLPLTPLAIPILRHGRPRANQPDRPQTHQPLARLTVPILRHGRLRASQLDHPQTHHQPLTRLIIPILRHGLPQASPPFRRLRTLPDRPQTHQPFTLRTFHTLLSQVMLKLQTHLLSRQRHRTSRITDPAFPTDKPSQLTRRCNIL